MIPAKNSKNIHKFSLNLCMAKRRLLPDVVQVQ